MRYYFDHDGELTNGLALLAEDLGIDLAKKEDADFLVAVRRTEKRELRVTLRGRKAEIVYGDGLARCFRGLALLTHWIKQGIKEKEQTETPLFRTNGAMVDMSRNVVMNVDTVKTMLRKMALMGMNTYMLYTEDTYELEGYPYFGYMRGRYTEAELRELDQYAMDLGIELIPCVQMLGHLSTHLRWDAAAPYRDTASVMLVGAEETYALIEKMLDTIARCFTTRRIHIGMDETHDLGRGTYLDRNGYKDPMELYFEHLNKILHMVRARGLQPMMWSDMFFRLAGKDLAGYDDYDERVVFTDEIARVIPQGIDQVYWDYYHKSVDYYANNMEKHRKIFENGIIFAGGVWTWSGFCPLYSRSLARTLPALDACREQGIEELIATVWGNGAECNMIVSLAGLAWYADYDYKGTFDEESVKECFAFSCGVSYDDMMKLELPEHPDGGEIGLCRSFVYNDPMMGLIDAHLKGLEVRDYYAKTAAELDRVGDMGIFAPAYDTVRKLTDLLEKKTDFGVRLKEAYDRGDRETLRAMADECDEIVKRLYALRDSHRASWMAYHKPLGWEVLDLRYGGLVARFETTKARLGEYLDGKAERLEELEEPRLRMDGQLSEQAQPRFHGLFNWMSYTEYATAGRF